MPNQDPFSDPFSPEPQTPAPVPSNLPLASAPVVAPAPSALQASNSVVMSPITVFIGSYAFAGIAAVLLANAIALVVALSDFRSQHLAIVAVAAASVVVAAVVLWLGLFDDRGRRWARTATWAVCGVAVVAAVAVFVLEPGNSVAWFAQLAEFGAGLTILAAVASALLLALPASNAYFQPASEPKPPKTVAAWVPSPPPASQAPPPAIPPPAPDDDPFS